MRIGAAGEYSRGINETKSFFKMKIKSGGNVDPKYVFTLIFVQGNIVDLVIYIS